MSTDQSEEHEASEPHGKNEPVVAAGQSNGVRIGSGNVQVNNVYGSPTRPEAREATEPSGPVSSVSGSTSQQTVVDTPPVSSRRWPPDRKLTLVGIVLGFIGVIAAAVISPLLASDGSSGSGRSPSDSHSPGASQIQCNNVTSNGQCVGSSTIINNNYGSTTSGASPQAQIATLTGTYSDKGFADAIFGRENRIVALYLKSGMPATTLYKGTSAILFGFENVDQNGAPSQSGDPVALVKTFLAGGFRVDTELEDSYLMGEITGGIFPSMFNTALTPKGYTGGYQDGTFVGSLLFWIVQKSLGWGPTDQDIQVIKYLISRGADCNVPLSFLKYSISIDSISANDAGIKELLPMMQSCAK